MPLNIKVLAQPLNEPLTLALAKSQCRVDSGMTADDQLITTYIGAARRLCEKLTNRAFFTQTWQRTLDNFPIASNFDYAPTAADRWNWANTGGIWNRLVIDLPGGPCSAIQSISYIDQNGVTQTLAASAYQADLTSTPCRIIPAELVWPFIGNVTPGSVQIVYTVGDFAQAVSENFQTAAGTQAYQLLQANSTLANLAAVQSVTTQGSNPSPITGWSVTPAGVLTIPTADENVPLTVNYTIANLPADLQVAMMLLVGHLYRNAEAATDLTMSELPYGVDALLSSHVIEWSNYRPC